MRRLRLEAVLVLLIIVGLFGLLRVELRQAHTRQLAIAVRNGDVRLARWLISKGADVNGRDEDGDLILMAAVRFLNEHDEEMVRLLETSGAQTDDVTKFMTAAFLNRADVVEQMLQSGLDPNVKDRDGDTALSAATQRGNVETVKVLLKHGTNPHTVNKNGLAVLDWALQCTNYARRKEVLVLLQKYGVKIPTTPIPRRRRPYGAVPNTSGQ
jgi:ankyrin repeat protein